MVIGICQTDIVFENKEHNLAVAEQCISACKEKGATLVLFPEMSMTGFTMEPEKVYEEENGITYRTMADYAGRYRVKIGYGYVSRKNDGFYNTYVIMDEKGTVICSYDKIHPFSYAGEDQHYKKGDRLAFCEIEGITICPLICYDLRFPELFTVAAKKADLITVAANFGGPRDEHWQTLLKARAMENQVFVAGINRVGEDNATYYKGHSMVVGPRGNVIHMVDEKEGISIADINKEEITEYKKEFPVYLDRRPEIYVNL